MLENLPLLVIILGAGFLAYVLLTQRQPGHASRRALADRHGWEYAAEAPAKRGETSEANRLYTLSGKIAGSGETWQLCAFQRLQVGQQAQRGHTLWQAPTPPGWEGQVFICKRTDGQPATQPGLATLGVMPLTPKAWVEEWKRDFARVVDVKRLKAVIAGTAGFQRSYELLASDTQVGLRAVQAGVDQALAAAGGMFAEPADLVGIAISPQMILMDVPWTIEKAEEMAQLVRAGERVYQALASEQPG